MGNTWYKELKDREIFYMYVTAHQIPTHLLENCGGLHATNIVNLPTEIQGYYENDQGIPDYINMLKDAQKRHRVPVSPSAMALL